MDEDGSFLSADEQSSLSKAMKLHLDVYHLHRRYSDAIVPPGAPSAFKIPILCCVYVKRGFVHILVFWLPEEENAEVSCYVVDSLPVGLNCETDDDLLDRLRIVIALFTLQRQVIKICEAWSAICWPTDVLADEHEAIVEETGICTPTPSGDLPPSDSPLWDYAFDIDIGSEDDPDYIRQCIRASRVRVKRWLAKVEPPEKLNELPL
ncbi:hypothetical protein EIP86_007595 [Pleurotus ostreatoroseus]|nr:hypothetical protein EIP86_007595 [Pleurotus ostreatoroseus]